MVDTEKRYLGPSQAALDYLEKIPSEWGSLSTKNPVSALTEAVRLLQQGKAKVILIQSEDRNPPSTSNQEGGL